jgi:hypothetical protein
MADPVSHKAVMSSMTEELAKNKFRQQLEIGKEKQTRQYFSQNPLRKLGNVKRCELENAYRNARFPWIHKREPADFHSMKILP